MRNLPWSCTGYEGVEGRSEWTKNVRYGFCFLLDAKEFFHHYWLSQGYWQEQTELPFLNFIIRLTVFDVSWTVQDLESDAKKKTLAFSFRKRFPLLPNTWKQKSFHAQFFTFQTFIHQHSAGKSKAYDFIYIFFLPVCILCRSIRSKSITWSNTESLVLKVK